MTRIRQAGRQKTGHASSTPSPGRRAAGLTVTGADNVNPMHAPGKHSAAKAVDNVRDATTFAINGTTETNVSQPRRSRSRVSTAMRDEITDRLGIKSSRIVKCCGRKWDKYTCKSIQFIALFVVMVLTGGAIFQAIEETHAIARARVIATQHSLARARVLTLLRGNETLFSQIAEAATILEGCSSTSKPRCTSRAVNAFAPTPVYTGGWSFFMSSLFAFELVTTIGYGTHAPVTLGGRLFLVVYTLIGIPAATMTLLYLAERALHCFSRLVQMRTDKIRKAFETYDDDKSGQLDLDEFRQAVRHLGNKLSEHQFQDLVSEIDVDASGEIDIEEFEVAMGILQADVTEAAGQKNRIKIVIGLFFAWMTIGVIVFTLTEADWGVSTAFYFTFVTLTTIGLGDEFPTQVGSRIFLVLFCMIGLGLLAALLTLGEELLRKLGKARKEALRKAREKNIAKKKELAKRQLEEKKGRLSWGRFGVMKNHVSLRMEKWKNRSMKRRDAALNGGGGGAGGGGEGKNEDDSTEASQSMIIKPLDERRRLKFRHSML